MHAAVLRYLDAVAKYGSIRKASMHLNVAASAINRQVLMTEDLLGVELFERRATGMVPTETGEMVLEHIRRTLHDFDAVKGEIAHQKAHLTGTVRIATLDSLTVHILPRAIMDFRRQNPGVTFRIETSDPPGVSRMVSNDSADIGLTFQPQSQPGLEVVQTLPAAMCAVMHRNHPLASRQSLSMFECPAAEVILQEDTGPIGDFLGPEFAELKRLAKPVLVTDTIIASKALILAGNGIGFFTRFGFLKEIEAGDVVAVPLEEAAPSSLTLATVIWPGRRQTRAVSGFLKYLEAVLDGEDTLRR